MDSYINLDKNLTSLDLRDYQNLNHIELNDECEIKELFIKIKDWDFVRNLKQFKNLEILIINIISYHNDDNKNNNKNIYLDFRSNINLKIIKTDNNSYGYSTNGISFSFIDVDKYNFSNSINLEELELKYVPNDLDISNCIKLKKLSIDDSQCNILKFNQPNIEILKLEGIYKNFDISNLVNLKELYCYDINLTVLDLINQTKLIKLVYKGYREVRNINKYLEYLEVNSYNEDSYEDYDEHLKIVLQDEIKKMINLKVLILDGFLIYSLNLTNLNKLEKINLRWLPELRNIYFNFNIPKDIRISSCPNIIKNNKMIIRRKIYLISEKQKNIICDKCKKHVNKYKLVNIRFLIIGHELYKFIKSCC